VPNTCSGRLDLVICAANFWAARRIGVRFALPTSRGFFIAVGVAVAFMVGALVAGDADNSALVVVLAVATTLSYGCGSVLHYRSTRPAGAPDDR